MSTSSGDDGSDAQEGNESREALRCANCSTELPWSWNPERVLCCNPCEAYARSHNVEARPIETEEAVCSNCATKQTSKWRFDKDKKRLCNTCWNYANNHNGVNRPPKLFESAHARQARRPTHKKEDSAKRCSNCLKEDVAVWWWSPEGDRLCRACERYSQGHDGKARPPQVISNAKDLDEKRRKRKAGDRGDQREYSNCFTGKTIEWRWSSGGDLLCRNCYVLYCTTARPQMTAHPSQTENNHHHSSHPHLLLLLRFHLKDVKS
jgi:hypothetical protein